MSSMCSARVAHRRGSNCEGEHHEEIPIAAAFIICVPQTILAQAEMFYVVLDHTTNQCTVMTNEPTTQKTRYKTLGKYATQDEAKAALDSMIGSACPKI